MLAAHPRPTHRHREGVRRRAITTAALLSGVLAAGGLAAAAAPASADPSSGVVLNEAYGGGGNSGSTYKNDFIELANRGSSAQDLGSWSVQYLSGSPSASSQWSVTNLTGSVSAGDDYLIGEAAGSGGTTDLPATQATGTTNLSGSSGTVALVKSQTALTCRTVSDCGADTDIVDLVGYGSAVVHEGSDAPAPANAADSDTRTSAPDSDNNSADFTSAPASPTGSGTTQQVQIHDIQGSTWVSPYAGQTVTDVPGIVTTVRTSGSSKGFWFQDADPDNNPATSEGLFVYTGSTPNVSPGDSVTVSGKVSDYYPLASGDTVSATSNLSVTELGSASVNVVSSGNQLPAPIVLGPNTVPDQYAPDLGGANIEKTPITPDRSALDFYESIEGMRVEVDNARVVGPSDQYGEQYVTTKPNQDVTYRGGTELTGENQTPSGRLEVVAADGTNPEVTVGDQFGGATVGAMDYSQYGGYTLVAQTLGTVIKGNLQPVVANAPKRNHMSVATYNVENLSPTDPQSKFDALGQGVVHNLASPDVIAVEEVQDNDGSTDDGVVSADQTLTKLTDAISAAGGPSYAWREIDPVNDQDGGEPGGNIRVVFLFNPARVSFVDSGASSVDRSTTGTQVVRRRGTAALTLSPGRIDPTNPAWSSSRKPLVGEFTFRGQNVFVIANHFDAKLGDQNADGRYQYPAQSSAIQRSAQAAAVHNFVASLLAVDKHADVVVVGDLNDYQFSPALHVLTTGTADNTGTPILTDLITTLPTDQQYTYDYDGISETLDHILVTPSVRGVDYQVVHVNAEFANQVSDHDPQVVDLKP